MSEQDGAQSLTKQRRSRQIRKPNDAQATAVQRPTNDDREAWKHYWVKVQPEEWFRAWGYWRTEPEIDAERQKYLEGHRCIEPDIMQGIYSFRNIEPKLTRADVEWLLATHENERGPVDWSNEHEQKRVGLDLRGADLRQINLHNLPLNRVRFGLTADEWANTEITDVALRKQAA